MAGIVVLLRKEIKDSLTRQGMQNVRGLYRKGLAERRRNVVKRFQLGYYGLLRPRLLE